MPTHNDQQHALVKHVAQQVALWYLVPVLVTLLFSAIFVLTSSLRGLSDAFRSETLSWFTVAVTVVVINSVVILILTRRMSLTLERIQGTWTAHRDSIQGELHRSLSRSIVTIPTTKAVREQAAKLLIRAAQEEFDDDRVVTYLGAASLGPTQIEEDALRERNADETAKAAQTFSIAFHEMLAAYNPVQILRYVNLF